MFSAKPIIVMTCIVKQSLCRTVLTLDREGVMVRIRCPKQPKRLPIVLSLDEMARFFAAVIGIKHRAILMTAYAAGLRHLEVRIRHYGFLANRVCRDKLALCRALLGAEPTPEPVAYEPCVEPDETAEELETPHTCPSCGVGRMVIVESFKAIDVKRGEYESILEPAGFDTS